MSEADKLFKELEYEDNPAGYGAIRYKNKKYNITFFKNQIMVTKLNTGDSFVLEPQEIKAINEKCKELGWIE